MAGAVLSYTDVTAKTATADVSGNYTLVVSYNWSGTVTPALPGYSFLPVSKSYTNVLANQTLQNYVATPLAPGAFSKASPLNLATNQPTGPVLTWGASVTATSYAYCIDTVNDNACNATWISTGPLTTVALTGKAPGTYYWQVSATNAYGTTYANGGLTAWWSFTILPIPGAFSKISPTNGASGQSSISTIISWGASTSVSYYQYCVNTSPTSCAVWSNTVSTSATLTGLIGGTTYYWQVRSRNNTGITYANGSSGAWWNFNVTQAPGAFSKNSPANAAINQSANPTLSWGTSSRAASYQYCINTTAACSSPACVDFHRHQQDGSPQRTDAQALTTGRSRQSTYLATPLPMGAVEPGGHSPSAHSRQLSLRSPRQTGSPTKVQALP